jgi:hypothetical protein
LLARQPNPQSNMQRNAMSNLPYPPANSGENAGSGQGQPEQPQYGQQAQPQYGQNAPQYGQQPSAPQYGQNAPQYGQQPPQYGQFGQQPSAPQYGQSPYGQAPWPSQQPAATSGVPTLVNISFWLILAAGVLTLVGIPLVLVTINSPAFGDAVEEAMRAQGRNNPGIDIETLRGIAATMVVIVSVIFAGLYALVAFNVRRGKNWARILGTIFAVVSLLGLGQISVGLITILLGIAAIVLLYLPASAPYFRKAQPFANPYSQGPYGR